MPAWPVKAACANVMNTTNSVSGIMGAVKVAYGDQKCYDVSKSYVHCADPTGCGMGPASIAWDYQACTQIMLTGSSGMDMFPHRVWNSSERAKYCKDTWNVV